MDGTGHIRPQETRTFQFRVDYQEVNTVATEDSYIMAVMDEWIDALGDAPIFSTWDGSSSYWLAEVANEDQDKRQPRLSQCTPLYSNAIRSKDGPRTCDYAMNIILFWVRR